MKLTKPQEYELKALGRGVRPNYGAATVRVQNTLIRMGLARQLGSAVEITDDGRKALVALAAKTNGQS